MEALEMKYAAVEKSFKQAPGFVKLLLLPLLEWVKEMTKRELERSKKHADEISGD